MPDAWPYTKPEVTELILKMLAGYEKAASGGPYRNGWMTTGAICAEMLAQHHVRLDREYVRGILDWLLTVGCLQSLPTDDGFGSLQRWRILPGVNIGARVADAGVLGG